MHRVLHARKIVINHINSSNSADALKTTYRCQGKRERKKKKKTTVSLYLMMAPLESSASFRASEALQRFTKIKNRKRREKERKRKITKKKKRRRNNNGIVIACWERRAIACRLFFFSFFFFLEGKTKRTLLRWYH